MSKKKITQAQLRQIIREELEEMDLQEAGPFGQRTMGSLLSTAQKAAEKASGTMKDSSDKQTSREKNAPPPPPKLKMPQKTNQRTMDDDDSDQKDLMNRKDAIKKRLVRGRAQKAGINTVDSNKAKSLRNTHPVADKIKADKGRAYKDLAKAGVTPVPTKSPKEPEWQGKDAGGVGTLEEHKEWSSYEGDQKLFENWRKFAGESK